MASYKDTLFLPQTDFAIKANLKQLEPYWLDQWQQNDLYNLIQYYHHDAPKFILHWGPPYANGHLHVGHALTSILKDVTCRIYRLKGYNAPLIPGWDCHGLPIEWKVEENYRAQKQNKDEVPLLEFRNQCRTYAQHWVTIQNQEFQRLGILYDAKNPYITMDFESEGLITQSILQCLENGVIYKGTRPIMWSVIEKTALAEAEIEYLDKESNSVYVRFPIINAPRPSLINSYAIIWTTTPWTLPGNRAIAYGSEIDYSVVEVNQTSYLMATDLIKNVCNALKWDNIKVIDQFKGDHLRQSTAQHPLYTLGYDFSVPLVSGDHVTTTAGTGLVHTAPGHGIEDFSVGKVHNLEIPETVNGDGFYYDHIPHFAGVHIYKADQPIIEALNEASHLLKAEKIIHSYPHSWRSKKPLIFRTTPQWFIAMDNQQHIRSKALNHIEHVEWFPKNGQNRITSMIANRPDWCISRQRSWGIPIPIFISKKSGQPLINSDVNQRIIDTIKQVGCDIWFQNDHQKFLGQQYDINDYDVVKDVVDVWFESGATQHFVLEQRSNLRCPADVYLEGSDQHRGWFQSSLLIGCATHGKAPFKKVITHGFTVDEHGRKMSKSLGNTLSLEKAVEEFGAEIIRLWVVNCDYTDDLRIGQNLLKGQQDIYRRYRNTLRYLLGALKRANLDQDIYYDDLPMLEKWILHQLYELNQQFSELLTSFNYQAFYANLHHFCTSDLSAFYFDVRKDCLYCDDVTSLKRRQTLFVMRTVFHFLIRVLSPVLCFTTQEAWANYTSDIFSLHTKILEEFPDIYNNKTVIAQFDTVRTLRKQITTVLEQARAQGEIRSSLQAHVTYSASENIPISSDDMAELCIVSSFTFVASSKDALVTIKIAQGEKCERCWKVLTSVGLKELHPTLCQRCCEVIENHDN